MNTSERRYIHDLDRGDSLVVPMHYHETIAGRNPVCALRFPESDVKIPFFGVVVCHQDLRRDGQPVPSLDLLDDSPEIYVEESCRFLNLRYPLVFLLELMKYAVTK